MEFAEYGSKNAPTLIFIHGSCTTAETCYSKVAEALKGNYHCVLCRLDGHYDGSPDFVSLDKEAEQIEEYVQQNRNGSVYALIGLSLGSTICVHLLTRKKLSVSKVFIDGVYVQNKGALYANMCALMCNIGIGYMRKGGKVPDKLIETVFGKGNRSVVDMMYSGTSKITVKNVCRQVYEYKLGNISADGVDIISLRGEYEPIPTASFKLLKEHIPHIREKVIPNCGHAQFLNEQPDKYIRLLTEFLKN